MNTRARHSAGTQKKDFSVLAAAEPKKKSLNPVIFNLLSETLLGRGCIGKKGYACVFHFFVRSFFLLQSKTAFHHVLVKVNYCFGRFSEAA